MIIQSVFKANNKSMLVSFSISFHTKLSLKLEDLKVLRRSPDLLNNVKIGQG